MTAFPDSLPTSPPTSVNANGYLLKKIGWVMETCFRCRTKGRDQQGGNKLARLPIYLETTTK